MLLPGSTVHFVSCHGRFTPIIVVEVLRGWIVVKGFQDLSQYWLKLILDFLDYPGRFCIHLMLLRILVKELLDSLIDVIEQAVEIFDFVDVVGHGVQSRVV
jgi:hypothetical protein